MTDLQTLTDAFAELERRADAVSAGLPPDLPTQVRRTGPRLVPIAATVAAVAGLAAAAALLAPGDPPGTPAAAPPSGIPTTVLPTPTPSSPAAPTTPQELAERFRAIVGDMATVTVTEYGPGAAIVTVPPGPLGPPSGKENPPSAPTTIGASLVGTLTAAGITGGFDLVVLPSNRGAEASCDGADPSCTVRRLPDGSTLAVSRVPLEGSPKGITYAVDLVRPNGMYINMHVSNQRSPKGASAQLAPHPPLTTDQMIAIVTSDRW